MRRAFSYARVGLNRPSPARVAKRALVLCAVTMRAIAEAEAESAGDTYAQSRAWLTAHGLDEELEPRERAFLDSALGTASDEEVAGGSWRAEGLAVLAWALGVAEVPGPEEEADPMEIWTALDFLSDGRPAILDYPALRTPAEIAAQNTRFTTGLLALEKEIISGQADESVMKALRATREREQALRWLRGDAETYSDVETTS